MTTTWILVANASEAHLYASEKAKLFNGSVSLNPIKDYSHPQSRQRCRELITDRAGHHHCLKAGSGTLVESADPHQRELDLFAKELAEELNRSFQQHRFNELVVAAPSTFRGRLNKLLASSLPNVTRVNIDKDYTKYTERDLARQLQHFL